MGGRGASIGRKAESPEELANRLYNEHGADGIGKVSDAESLASEFAYFRQAVKEGNTRVLEEDEQTTFAIIQKDGTSYTLTVGNDSYEDWKAVDLRKTAYIRRHNADGINDTLGYNENTFQDTAKQQAYEDQIERIFKTKWGRTH